MADRVFPAPAALLRRDRTGPETSERSAFQFLDPLAGRLCGIAGPSLIAPEGPPSPQTFFPGRSPNWPVRCDGHRPSLQLESTAPRPSRSFRRCALRSCLCLALPQIAPLLSHRLPGPAGLLPLEPRAPVLPPLVIASHRKAEYHPDPKLPKCSRCAQGLHAHAAQNGLQACAAFGLRPIAGAFEERHHAQTPSAAGLLPTSDRIGRLADDPAQFSASFRSNFPPPGTSLAQLEARGGAGSVPPVLPCEVPLPASNPSTRPLANSIPRLPVLLTPVAFATEAGLPHGPTHRQQAAAPHAPARLRSASLRSRSV